MLTGGVPYGFNGFFASVLSVARRSVGSAFYLINLTFGFKFLVARCGFLLKPIIIPG